MPWVVRDEARARSQAPSSGGLQQVRWEAGPHRGRNYVRAAFYFSSIFFLNFPSLLHTFIACCTTCFSGHPCGQRCEPE